MNAQHTPGPWVAWDDGVTVGIETDDGNPIAVAEVIDNSDWADEGQMRADQALITAAPDLLAALENLVNSFEKHRPKEFWVAARIAIAKATGAA
jgi:hypothetical protein